MSKNNDLKNQLHDYANYETLQQFIKVIDIDTLPEQEVLRIIAAIGSKNIAYFLALIVNLENKARKLSPQTLTKITSTKSISAPSSNPKIIESNIENKFNTNHISNNPNR